MAGATKRTDQKAATRAKLLATAAALFTARGYEHVGVRDIAAEAGLSTGAVFAHWSGKDALWEEAIGRKPPTGRFLAWLESFATGNEGIPPRDVAAQLLADFRGQQQ